MNTELLDEELKFAIPCGYMELLDAKLAKLNKAAAKLGCAPVGYEVIETKEYLAENLIDIEKFYIVRMTGTAPRFEGWSFLATLQHVRGEDGWVTIVRKTPFADEDIDVREYRTCAPHCDHCKLQRQRKDTYLVRHLDHGTLRQIGRNCIRDFLGHNSPEQVAGYIEFLARCHGLFSSMADDDDMGGDRCGGTSHMSLPALLSYTAEAVKRFGWVSRKASRESLERNPATVDLVMANFDNMRSPSESTRSKVWHPCDESEQLAEAALSWLRDGWGQQDYDSLNDYQHSLVATCLTDAVDLRNLGLAASLIGVYTRELADQAEKQARAEKPVTRLDGNPGDRLRGIQAQLVTVSPIPGWDGMSVSYLHRFLTNDGAELVWFSSNEWTLGEYLIDFTIKAQEEYKGKPQTKVLRVAVSKPKAAKKSRKTAATV